MRGSWRVSCLTDLPAKLLSSRWSTASTPAVLWGVPGVVVMGHHRDRLAGAGSLPLAGPAAVHAEWCSALDSSARLCVAKMVTSVSPCTWLEPGCVHPASPTHFACPAGFFFLLSSQSESPVIVCQVRYSEPQGPGPVHQLHRAEGGAGAPQGRCWAVCLLSTCHHLRCLCQTQIAAI